MTRFALLALTVLLLPGRAAAQGKHYPLESSNGNDVKSGAHTKGAVALWIGPETVAHFRNLTVKPASGKNKG